MSDRIVIEALQIDALIGVYPHERTGPQPLLLDLELDYDNRHPAVSDAISDAIDYAAVCLRARELAGSLQPQLLETLAEALAAELLRASAATSVRVYIRKPQAARTLGALSVGVDIRRDRGDGLGDQSQGR